MAIEEYVASLKIARPEGTIDAGVGVMRLGDPIVFVARTGGVLELRVVDVVALSEATVSIGPIDVLVTTRGRESWRIRVARDTRFVERLRALLADVG